MSTFEELEQAVEEAHDAWVADIDAKVPDAHIQCAKWVDAQYALYSYRDVEENTK